MSNNQERQIVSRERVSEHGEVYTGEREVRAMLDLVKAETERIDSRFLEPACGNGNFMVEILRRKLAAVMKPRPYDRPNQFSDLGDEAFIPTRVKEYKCTN